MYCDIASDMALILIQSKLRPILIRVGLLDLNIVNNDSQVENLQSKNDFRQMEPKYLVVSNSG